MAQFKGILKNDVGDMYEPTGCWSPTFKASYNDVNLLVQMAVKKINSILAEGGIKSNFVVNAVSDSPQISNY